MINVNLFGDVENVKEFVKSRDLTDVCCRTSFTFKIVKQKTGLPLEHIINDFGIIGPENIAHSFDCSNGSNGTKLLVGLTENILWQGDL